MRAIKRTPYLSKHDLSAHRQLMVMTVHYAVESYENAPIPNSMAMVRKWFAAPHNIFDAGYYIYHTETYSPCWNVIDWRTVIIDPDCTFQSDVDVQKKNHNWNKIVEVLGKPENEIKPQAIYMMVAPADRRNHLKDYNYRIFYVLFADKGDRARFLFHYH